MQLIDTHFHLDYYQNHDAMYKMINALKQYTLCVTNSPEVFFSCKRLYEETKYIKFALGYHPQQAKEIPLNQSLFLHAQKDIKYIGEIGLDFSKVHYDTKLQQLDAFNFICKTVANTERKQILSIHSRQAEQTVLDILTTYNIKNGIIHWYTGEIKTLHQFIDKGYYFSINSNMCNSEKGRKIIRSIPIEKILIESDGPFTKVNSKKYNPSDLQKVYEIVEDILSVTELNSIVWKNFKQLLES